MAADMETIVWEGEDGALLRYPSQFQVQLVSAPYGSLKTSKGENSESSAKHGSKRNRRKRKHVHVLNHGEYLQRRHFLEIRDHLLQCYHSLLSIGQKIEYFADGHPETQQGRPGPDECHVDLAALCSLDALSDTQNEGPPCVIDIANDITEDDLDLFGSIVCNTSANELSISCWRTEFSLPPHSTFLLADFARIRLLTSYAAMRNKNYNLVVIDPPWENRSAIRGNKYQWLDEEKLKSLPVRELATSGALVAVWVTNKRRLVHLVKETLFPAWMVKFVGEWTWLKVTTGGKFVFDFDSDHKKPYESLVLGRVHSSSIPLYSPDLSARESSGDSHSHGSEQEGGCLSSHDRCKVHVGTEEEASARYEVSQEEEIRPCKVQRLDVPCPKRMPINDSGRLLDSSVPCFLVFLCIPSTIHSQKPYLGDLLSKYVDGNLRGIELFARNLLPGWTSWGNEVLKYQVKKSSN